MPEMDAIKYESITHLSFANVCQFYRRQHLLLVDNNFYFFFHFQKIGINASRELSLVGYH